LPGGIGYPPGSDERFPRCNRYISSSFPELTWRNVTIFPFSPFELTWRNVTIFLHFPHRLPFFLSAI
jgi:hypothetical protein